MATINGTENADTLEGTNDADRIDGLGRAPIRSTAARATTASTRARATTRSTAARAATTSSAATATTASPTTPTVATTGCAAGPATTSSRSRAPRAPRGQDPDRRRRRRGHDHLHQRCGQQGQADHRRGLRRQQHLASRRPRRSTITRAGTSTPSRSRSARAASSIRAARPTTSRPASAAADARTGISSGKGVDAVTLDIDNDARYRLKLGEGQDVVTLRRAASGATDPLVKFKDFAAGDTGDKLDLDAYLASVVTGSPAANAFASGHLRLIQDGADAVLQIDLDGAGTAFGFEDMVWSSRTRRRPTSPPSTSTAWTRPRKPRRRTTSSSDAGRIETTETAPSGAPFCDGSRPARLSGRCRDSAGRRRSCRRP